MARFDRLPDEPAALPQPHDDGTTARRERTWNRHLPVTAAGAAPEPASKGNPHDVNDLTRVVPQ